LLINAVKDVANALGELISATKNASGKTASDPSMNALNDTAKKMVTNVTSLLKTVKTVEDENARGTRALEAAIDAVDQELKVYVQTDHVVKRVTPEELIHRTKPITLATAKTVAAGNSGLQEDVIAAANMGRRAVADLLQACKGASGNSDTQELRHRVKDSGRNCCESYKVLLEHVAMVLQKASPDNRQKLAVLSKRVASAVTEIVQSAEALKGTDWVDPDDPTAIAEAELLTAANQIEAAARKLMTLRPRAQFQPQEADEDLNFEEQILEAAKHIAAATATLIKAAGAAQRELVAQGRIGAYSSDPEDDSQWSQGLVSAAFLVAAATRSLCEAANSMVQGSGSDEALISAARQVASSTAQLLVACKVKADTDSVAMRNLQKAGNAVKRATEALVSAARAAAQYREDPESIAINQRHVGGIAQMIQAQEEILMKERELETARRKLETIRREKYKNRPPDYDSGSDF
jgi:talin